MYSSESPFPATPTSLPGFGIMRSVWLSVSEKPDLKRFLLYLPCLVMLQCALSCTTHGNGKEEDMQRHGESNSEGSQLVLGDGAHRSSILEANHDPYSHMLWRDRIHPLDTFPETAIAGNFSDQKGLTFDSLTLVRFLNTHPLFKPFQIDFFKFYAGRNYAYAWHDQRGRIEQSNILYNRILDMADNGLSMETPYVERYQHMMENPESHPLVDQELMLTGQYLYFAKRLLTGMPDAAAKMKWFIPRKKTDYTLLLEKIIAGEKGVVGKSLYPLYPKLQQELKRLYGLEKKGGWEYIPLQKKSLRKGDSSLHIPLVRKRLIATGELADSSSSEFVDAALESAVKIFQNNHGLVEDGVIGAAVLREMNVSIRERIEKIIVNMERCRWLPNPTDEAYVVVNIPEFKLFAYEEDSLVFSSNVVVGKETNKTVIFKGNMKYVVFSPYWNIPESIMEKEVLPAQRRNSQYMEKNNMEWFDGKIRQKPGENNALGKVKFLFPNVYNIYLHDTPSKSLFKKEKRTFSHGCIRVADPKNLAKFLLRNQKEWTEEKINTAMESEKEQYVALKKSIPVYIVYFTAFVDNNGRLNFRNDVYKRDEAMKEMLINQP